MGLGGVIPGFDSVVSPHNASKSNAHRMATRITARVAKGASLFQPNTFDPGFFFELPGSSMF
jgi:hypothetical protein